ncbi:MAG: cyclase family protein [Verrucomicrobia bacterium]|nr:MAG: cyclase family protein [Verrucomicrobiota bacterium]
MATPRLIDLTLPLGPALRGVQFETARTLEKDGWNARTLHLYSHAGTHMDAQTHFGAGPETIDRIPLERCLGPAHVAHLPGLAPRSLLTPEHLGALAETFPPGESLLLHTGWSRHVSDPSLYRDGLPRVGEALARWCVAHRVKLLGVEPPSIADVNHLPEVTAIHRILLEGGVTIVEGLANLDRLTAPRVLFGAFPLPIESGDGCPCRAFAFDGIPAGLDAPDPPA